MASSASERVKKNVDGQVTKEMACRERMRVEGAGLGREEDAFPDLPKATKASEDGRNRHGER
jgi:hypothetical protein